MTEAQTSPCACLAGFDAEESVAVFKQIDCNGTGDVSIDEFEAW
jgi:hypothetical protein